MNSSYIRYATVAICYGLIRKGLEMKNATITYYDFNRKKQKTPVLLCDKVYITLISGIASFYAWPIFLYNDLKKMEIKYKKLDDWVYDYFPEKENAIDYLFT